MLTDTHIHLDAATLDPDRDDVLERARCRRASSVSSCPASMWRASIEWRSLVALRYADIYHGLGIHPLYVMAAGDHDLDILAARLAEGGAHRGRRDRSRLFRRRCRPRRAGALLRRATQARPALRPAGDPARAPRGRRDPQAVTPHRACGRHRTRLQRQPPAGRHVHRDGFQAGLWRRDDLRWLAAHSLVGGRCRSEALVLESDAPDMAPAWAAGAAQRAGQPASRYAEVARRVARHQRTRRWATATSRNAEVSAAGAQALKRARCAAVYSVSSG
jgi:TatD DNase family protein